MLLCVYLVLLVLACRFPKSKLLTAVLMLLLWAVYSLLYYEGDLQSYEVNYQNLIDGAKNLRFEPGFRFLMKLCVTVGIPFRGFRMLVGTLFVLLTWNGIRKSTEYTALCTAFFFLFPLFVYVSVLRTGIAGAIVMNFLPALAENKRYSKAKYAIGVILAATFHISSLLLLLVLLVQRKISPLKMGIGIAAAAVLFVILEYTDVLYRLVSKFTQSTTILSYVQKGDTHVNLNGFIGETAVLLTNAFLLSQAREIYAQVDCPDCPEQKWFAELMTNIASLMLLLLPVFIFSSVFMRLTYMVFPSGIAACINARAIASKSPFSEKNELEKFLLTVGTPAVAVLFMFFYMLPYLKSGAVLYGALLNPVFG